MERKELAVSYKHNGHNCAQAVLCAFANLTDYSEDELRKIGAAFGTGMGCLGVTCGALCGAQMLLSLARYNGRPIARDSASLFKAFEQKCGATICGELKGCRHRKGAVRMR